MPYFEPVQAQAAATATGVHGALREAAARTDTSFDFLLAQAQLESSLDPAAEARTSSAAGLFQFVTQTWLTTLGSHGREHGYGWAAEAISMDGGRATVSDPGLRRQIMQLRFDPLASSLMAGELAQDNRAYLEDVLGRAPDNTELYLAHFLGAKGAGTFIAAHAADPAAPAAALLPQAARANAALFFDSGRSRSLGELRDLISDKLENGGPRELVAPSLPPSQAFAGLRREHAGVAALQPAAALPAAAHSPRASMAEILQQAFSSPQDRRAPAHVDRAYRTIARFGL